MKLANESIKTLFRARNFPRMSNIIIYLLNNDEAILYSQKNSTNEYHKTQFLTQNINHLYIIKKHFQLGLKLPILEILFSYRYPIYSS